MEKGLQITHDEIIQAKNNQKFVEMAARQVVKDFATCGMAIEFPSDIIFAYDQLFDQVLDIISELLNENEEKLRALLYRIDLSEKNMKQATLAASDQTRGIIIAELILEREMQKVLIRNYFSNL
ncbi:MAG: hypothetical protein ACOC0C_02465 [Bacteroidota bacterium]